MVFYSQALHPRSQEEPLRGVRDAWILDIFADSLKVPHFAGMWDLGVVRYPETEMKLSRARQVLTSA